MLLERRTPGPPWLPIPPFAERGALILGALVPTPVDIIAALVLVDRAFGLLAATPWTVHGAFGLRLSDASVPVPNGAEWWAVGVTRLDDGPAVQRPWEAFRVSWRLHL